MNLKEVENGADRPPESLSVALGRISNFCMIVEFNLS
jgi:hypothetical protein